MLGLTPNMGTMDRAIRVVVGLVVLGLGYYYGSLLGLVGLVPLATSLLGWCPAYLPFGISTRGKSSPDDLR